jgi:hypothetical protein
MENSKEIFIKNELAFELGSNILTICFDTNLFIRIDKLENFTIILPSDKISSSFLIHYGFDYSDRELPKLYYFRLIDCNIVNFIINGNIITCHIVFNRIEKELKRVLKIRKLLEQNGIETI